MLPQSRLDKISEMENLLNEAESFLAEAEQCGISFSKALHLESYCSM